MRFLVTVTFTFTAFIGTPMLTTQATILAARQGTGAPQARCESSFICSDNISCGDGCECTPFSGSEYGVGTYFLLT